MTNRTRRSRAARRYKGLLNGLKLVTLAVVMAAASVSVLDPHSPAAEIGMEILKGSVGGALLGMALVGIRLTALKWNRRLAVSLFRIERREERPDNDWTAWAMLCRIVDTECMVGEITCELLRGGAAGALVGIAFIVLDSKILA